MGGLLLRFFCMDLVLLRFPVWARTDLRSYRQAVRRHSLLHVAVETLAHWGKKFQQLMQALSWGACAVGVARCMMTITTFFHRCPWKWYSVNMKIRFYTHCTQFLKLQSKFARSNSACVRALFGAQLQDGEASFPANLGGVLLQRDRNQKPQHSLHTCRSVRLKSWGKEGRGWP